MPTPQDCELEYSPFRAISIFYRDLSDRQVTLDVKRTLVLVCKAWRVLAMEVMFEIVRIRHGTKGLCKATERSGQDPDIHTYGRWVRHIEINPHIVDFDPLNPIEILEILQQCTRAEILTRPHAPGEENHPLSQARFEPERHFPPLPTLKRIDWWMPSVDFYTSDSENHDFLDLLLRNSPNLTYLCLSEDVGFSHSHRNPGADAIVLQSLTTLRVESRTDHLFGRVLHWSLPKLTNLILNPGHFQLSAGVLKLFGPQLRVLELLFCESLYNKECLEAILIQCPNLWELNFHVDTLYAMPLYLSSHQNLQCVRLHLSVGIANGRILPSIIPDRGIFDLSLLPSLERIVLHGPGWNVILNDRHFHCWRDLLPRDRCVMELSDGTRVP